MKNLLFTFILTLLSALTSAQTFSNISIAEASTVCSIVQDEQGMVWLGTEGGLYSYDGYRTIPHNTSANGTTIATRIHSMLVSHNIIYMGTERGLLVYDIRSGRYKQPLGQSPKDIRAVAMHEGRLWMGSATGLYSCSLADNDIRLENRQLQNVYSLLSTPRGLLVGTLSGLALCLPNGSMRRISIGNSPQPLVNALTPDRGTQDVWIGTEGALYRYDWRTFQPVAPLAGNSIKSLALHGDNIYAGTDNGMFIYNKVTNTVRHALHDSRSARSIANNIVWAVQRPLGQPLGWHRPGRVRDTAASILHLHSAQRHHTYGRRQLSASHIPQHRQHAVARRHQRTHRLQRTAWIPARCWCRHGVVSADLNYTLYVAQPCAPCLFRP